MCLLPESVSLRQVSREPHRYGAPASQPEPSPRGVSLPTEARLRYVQADGSAAYVAFCSNDGEILQMTEIDRVWHGVVPL